MLRKRGYEVTLAEASTTLGGRVARERLLPGLSAWGRVADYRTGQIAPAAECRDLSRQPPDRRGRARHGLPARRHRHRRASGAAMPWPGCILHPIPTDPAMPVFTPDDLMAGQRPQGGRVMLYDDDHFYMGSVLAELLVARGCNGAFRHPRGQGRRMDRQHAGTGHDPCAACWSSGVTLHLSKAPEAIGDGEVTLACTWTGRQTTSALRCGGDGHLPHPGRRAVTTTLTAAGLAGRRHPVGQTDRRRRRPRPDRLGHLCRPPLCRGAGRRPTSATPCRSAARSSRCRVSGSPNSPTGSSSSVPKYPTGVRGCETPGASAGAECRSESRSTPAGSAGTVRRPRQGTGRTALPAAAGASNGPARRRTAW